MAGFNAVWSIDIGKFSLKAVHLRRLGAHVVVQGTDRIEYDMGPEGVDSIGGAKEALQIFCSRNSVRDPVVVCLPGQDTLPRFIKIVADDEKKLEEIVNFEARQQIPFDIQEVVWDWQLVPRDYVAGQEKEIGIFAARRETVDDLLIELGGRGIRGQQVICGDLALLNFVLYELRPKTPSVILDIGADHTALILVDSGAFWIRALPFSGNQITRELSQRFRLTFNEAERVKRQAAKSPQKDKIFLALQKMLGDFATEVQRSVAFYKRQIAETSFETAYLLGQASSTLGLGQIVQDRLGWKVQRIASLTRMRPVDGLDVAELRTQLASLAPALGAGLQGLGVAATNVDLMPHEQQVQLAFTRRRKMVFVAGAVLLLALFVVGRIYDGKADSALLQNKDSADIAAKLDKAADELAKTADIPLLKAKLDALKAIGQERAYLSQSALEVNKLFTKIEKDAHQGVAPGAAITPLGVDDPRARTIFIAKVEDENEAKPQAKAYADAVHKKMAWLLSFETKLEGLETEKTKTGEPKVSAAPRATDKGKPKGKGGEPPPVPPLTYVCTLTGAVVARETPDDSRRLVETLVQTPLTAQLRKNKTLAGHVLSEPKLQVLAETALTEPAGEDDKLFGKQWALVEAKLLREPVKPADGRTPKPEAAATAEEPKYYMFSLKWTVSEKPVKAAAGAKEPTEETVAPPEEEGEQPAETKEAPPEGKEPSAEAPVADEPASDDALAGDTGSAKE